MSVQEVTSEDRSRAQPNPKDNRDVQMIKGHVECRYSIPATNQWVARAKYATARPVATQFSRHGGIDDLTTGRSVNQQAMCVIDEIDFL